MIMRSMTKPVPDTDRYHVPNLDRALAILEFLAAQTHPCGITEIADALSFPKNSVFRIAATLHAHGYLRREEPGKRYLLTSKFLSLGYAAVHEGHLVENSLDIMREVRTETGETAMVGIIDGLEGVVLEHCPSQQQVQVAVAVGTRFALHTSAPGKAMLAAMPAAECEAILDRIEYPVYTPRTIASKLQMIEHLNGVREKGYAVDDAEHNEGIRCIGAAMLNHRNSPVGAIWVTGPAFRMPRKTDARNGAILAAAAQTISQRFGHSGA